jgi:F-type H+-transporting ATPase subunit delta
MRNPRLARRYAHALFGVAERHGVGDRVGDELRRLVEVIGENKAFRGFLATPRVPPAEKERVLRTILDGLAHESLLEFILFTRRKGRLGLLSEIDSEYRKILEAARKRLVAQVTSAVPLEPVERARLKTQLSSRTGFSVELEETVDPRVIGGAAVTIGGQRLDDTILYHLNTLREELRGVSVHMSGE